jgi:hypothetical protein
MARNRTGSMKAMLAMEELDIAGLERAYGRR